MQEVNARTLLSDAKFFDSYSRWDDTLGRYERWNESVERVMNMHRKHYKDKKGIGSYIDEAEKAYKEKRVLGAQRALQFGGDQLIKHPARLYNCFDVETRFLTSKGIRAFSDFNDGDEIVVLTHLGNWKSAKVKSYGHQKLNKIVLSKGANEKIIYATKDHRWLLHDSSDTSSLKVGDRLLKEPFTFDAFSWETADPLERLYWCYGYVYGDGTNTNNGYSHVRLCKNDVKYVDRFVSMGFKTSRTASLAGDAYVYTGSYQKTLPDPEIDSPELIRAFVSGYLHADGVKNNTEGGKSFKGIQATGIDAIKFIRNIFPIAGVHIISEKDWTHKDTNFGKRSGITSRFTTCDHSGSKYNSGWKVIDIIPTPAIKEVWCLEVEDDHSFILDGGIVTGNCSASYADRADFFGEYFYLLLCGCGVGFSVQHHHVEKLPDVIVRKKQPKTHVVEDSIEGWATAMDVLLSSYFQGGGKHPEYEGRKIYFDLNNIRKKGAPISGGFKAPGPEPLRMCLDRVEHLIQGKVLKGETRLRPIEVYDICMHIADAVLSGGVRRAATICLFSVDDKEMTMAKTGNWYYENPQRARSNNSAVIHRNKTNKTEFSSIMQSIKQFGEPGFFFADGDEVTNPCVEISLYPRTEDGRSGFEMCNLTEINGSGISTEEDFYQACKSAAILGTLQAGYTDFKFLTPTTKEIVDREALLGVSITGFMNSPDILFNPEVLKRGAEIVRKTNEEVAKVLEINQAARTTCVKPSGSASVILGTASGIHAEHSKKYIRNVQFNKSSGIAASIQQHNPHMVEESIWSAGKTDYVVSFPVIAENSYYKDDYLGVKHLELVKLVQENWVIPGTNVDLCVKPGLRHNVSNTILVDDWDAAEEYVYNNRNIFTGVAFLSLTGDKDYYQAPNIEVLDEMEIITKYGAGAIFASGLIVDGLKTFDNFWDACAKAIMDNDGVTYTPLQIDWIRRFNQFAENYFDGDIKKTEYCLKDVYILHKWKKIQAHYKEFDLIEELNIKPESVDIDTMAGAACVGVTENGELGCAI